jgi:hypothetical protein
VPPAPFSQPTQPNIGDFWAFLLFNVDIPIAALPLTSPYPAIAYQQALALTNNAIGGVLYVDAVYNCGTHALMSIAPDQSGQNYFKSQRSREGLGLILPSTGLVAATSDESTSTTLASPEWAAHLTVDQLDFYRSPWGRRYLAYNQKAGPNVWGLT